MAHDVFISHSARDRKIAEAVCAMFEGRGITCWIAQRDILPGADWGETIIDAISASRVMIVIISRNANESTQVKREVALAVDSRVEIIAFRVENVHLSKALKYHISTTHWMDALTPPLEQHIHRLANRVGTLLPRRVNSGPGAQAWGAPPPAPTPDPSPHQSFPPNKSYPPNQSYPPNAAQSFPPGQIIPPGQSFPPSTQYGQRPAPAPYQPARPPVAPPTFYARPNSGGNKALTALIVGIAAMVIGYFFAIGILIGPVAIYLGAQELRAIKMRRSPPSGRGLAITAVVFGFMGIGMALLFIVIFVIQIISHR